MKKRLIHWLGLTGILALLSYAAAVVFSPMAYPGYNWMAQAVSDLSAEAAPSRQLWNRLAAPYNVCGVICATSVALFVSQARVSSRLLRVGGTRWEFIGELFRNGVRESEVREPGWEEIVLGNTIQILVYLRRAVWDRSAAPLQAEKPELLDQVLAYMEEHLSEKITLEDFAKHFWVSQSTISQTFRNKLGVSFYRCVTQRRLIAAKNLIIEGIPLESVGRKVGFSDYSSFYRAFKQEFGISPRQFRKKLESPEHASIIG
jgi:AraC-like DNA-binding protein